MVLCEHFIFTSAHLEEKSGYQVVAQSSGITHELLKTLEDYMYPAGLDQGMFAESKSMLVLKDRIAFTRATNIGAGYDGRPNTVYSHTIIMNSEDFGRYCNDSRVFNESYVEKRTREHLARLPVDPKKLDPDFSCMCVLGTSQFGDFIRAVFRKKKIAVLDTKDGNLLQSLVSLLPPSLRRISFSTLVAEPQRQPKFDLIQTQSGKSSLERYHVIDPGKKRPISPTKDPLFEQCIDYLVDVIGSKRSARLMEIYGLFEDIAIKDYRERLSLAVLVSTPDPKQSLLLNQRSRHRLQSLLSDTPESFTVRHLSRLKPLLPKDVAAEYSAKLETSKLLSDHLAGELTCNSIVDLFHGLSDGTLESRLLLFHRLAENRTEDFRATGHKILIGFVDDFYNQDVIRGFVENGTLHQCIFQALENPATDRKKQQRLFQMLVKYALFYNTDLLERLFAVKVFDLNDEYDAFGYRDIMVEFFKSAKFHKKLKPEIIFTVTKQVLDHIDQQFPENRESGSIGRRLYCIKDILYVLLDTIKCLSSVRHLELNEMLKKELKGQELYLERLLDQNRPPETGYFPIH